MAITVDTLKFFTSERMTDNSDGGGQMTATQIVSGASNQIFDDLSDVDRAAGDVSLRKVYAAVTSADTDKYLDSGIVVFKPPADDAVSVLSFSTGSFYDERADLANRLEAYLLKSSLWQGALYENHIVGMRQIAVIQRVNTVLPPIGKTLCLVQDEGLETEEEQYVRVTNVEAVETTFTDINGDYVRWIVRLDISDALRFDFNGHQVNRYDTYTYTDKARLRDTSVADAARYYGIAPLTVAAAVNDLTVRLSSVYGQLVPSTQTEKPIVNQYLSGETAPMIASRVDAATYSYAITTLSIAPSALIALLTGALPGSITVTRGAVVITDDGAGGAVYNGTVVGAWSYDTGECRFYANAPTSSGSATALYQPAAVAPHQSHTLTRKVTVENRRLNWVETLNPLPAAGTLTVAFMAQGNWYVLSDNGQGILQGSDVTVGVGTVSYVTGSVLATLGALPDAGSAVVFTWATSVHYGYPTNATVPAPAWQFTTEYAIVPGSITLTWETNSTTKTVTDAATTGVLLGDGIGLVHYASGRIWFRPDLLPDPTTTPQIVYDRATHYQESFTPTKDGNGFVTVTLTHTPVVERSISIQWETIRSQTASEKSSGNVGQSSYYSNLVAYSGSSDLSDSESWSKPIIISSPSFNYMPTVGVLVTNTMNTTTSSSLSAGQKTELSGKTASRQYFENSATNNEGNIVVVKTATDDGAGAVIGPQHGTANYTTGEVRFIPTDIIRASSWGLTSGGTVSTATTEAASDTSNASNAGSDQYVYGGTSSTVGTTSASSTSTSTAASGGGDSTAESGAWGSESFTDEWGNGSTIIVDYDEVTVTPTETTETMDAQPLIINLTPTSGDTIVPGSVLFEFGGATYVDRNGALVMNPDGVGSGLAAGSIDYAAGLATLTFWTAGEAPVLNVRACLTRYGVWQAISASFRASVSPLKPESVTITATTMDGVALSGTADADGVIDEDWMYGLINYQYGLGAVAFGQFQDNPDDPGNDIWISRPVDTSTLRYNAVGYTYLPLDATIIGVDPVRLPSDGRVPIFRSGQLALTHHTDSFTESSLSPTQVLDCGRLRLYRVVMEDVDEQRLPASFYSVDRALGIVTMASDLNLTGYTAPYTIYHTVADLAVITDSQITGDITFNKALSHTYPINDTYPSYVSNLLYAGTLQARYANLFAQSAWTSVWSDTRIGDAPLAQYNDTLYPLTVSNLGAYTDRFLIKFTSSTAFQVIGENLGLVATGNINEDCAPVNSLTGQPYFTIDYRGWGAGWATGNCVRFNLIGASTPVDLIRAVQPSDPTGLDDSVELLFVGNVDA